MAIEVKLGPFMFPNFIRVQEWEPAYTYPVAHLTEEQAAAYWDEMKPLWLAHVARHRANWKKAGAPELAAVAALRAVSAEGKQP